MVDDEPIRALFFYETGLGMVGGGRPGGIDRRYSGVTRITDPRRRFPDHLRNDNGDHWHALAGVLWSNRNGTGAGLSGRSVGVVNCRRRASIDRSNDRQAKIKYGFGVR